MKEIVDERAGIQNRRGEEDEGKQGGKKKKERESYSDWTAADDDWR